MAFRLLSWLTRPALLRAVIADARLALRLLREPRVPLLVKALPALGLLYLFFPVDLVPDFLPFAGQIDDTVALVVALKAFLALCPSGAVAHHREALTRRSAYAPMTPDGEIIDAEYRRDA